MDVKAKQDVLTERGLKIATKGTAGRIVNDARPRSSEHWGKVLVVFDGHTRGYWCSPEKLSFPKSVDPSTIAASPKERDPYKGVPRLPIFSGEHEFHFGANLRMCRRARKMSQVALAEEMAKVGSVKVAQSTICYREGHGSNPSGWFVAAAAKALSVPPFIFFVNLGKCKVYTESKKFLNGCSSSICQ